MYDSENVPKPIGIYNIIYQILCVYFRSQNNWTQQVESSLMLTV